MHTSMRARWVAEANYHMTLRFLGAIDPRMTVELDARMRTVMDTTSPFACRIDRLGAFPHADRARVLWAGGDSPLAFRLLHAQIDQVLVDLGFSSERTDRQTHITFARLKDRPDVQLPKLLSARVPDPPLNLPVDRVLLMQSTLTPRGPRYDLLYSWPAGGASGAH
jgi:RNA 2',3'-cyclic 3'-phosphodiesterase